MCFTQIRVPERVLHECHHPEEGGEGQDGPGRTADELPVPARALQPHPGRHRFGSRLVVSFVWPDSVTDVRSLPVTVAVVTDWNDTLAPAFRRSVNFFVPCYFQAFPPYRQQFLPADSCPVAQFTSADQPLAGMRPNGQSLLDCVVPVSAGLTLALFLLLRLQASTSTPTSCPATPCWASRCSCSAPRWWCTPCLATSTCCTPS
jgi:hypothetical protein